MSVPKQKLREVTFQILFSLDGGAECDAIVEMLMKELKISKSAVRASFDYANKIFHAIHELDPEINQASKDYSVDRITAVERNVLRLALYEMKHEPDLPPLVVIKEAIRLARKFSSSDGARFVNAVLDEIYKSKKQDTC